MGYATVVDGGPDGRYTIELNYGEWRRVEILAAVSAAISQLETQLGLALEKLEGAEEKEAAARQRIAEEADAYAAQMQGLPAGTPFPSPDNVTFEKNKLAQLQVQHQDLRTLVDAIKFDLAEARKVAARMNTLQALETRQAWCVDLTEDRAPGSQVGTIEIPGEPKLVLIAPGARGWMSSDGFLMSRELQRPDQAFLNAALLPGVTKWKPTYRRGTCTSKDDEANTMSVSLTPETAAGLDVNLRTSLHGVPVDYLWCNSKAFDVGDQVVVQFTAGDWSSPLVIGFVDNPKQCGWRRQFTASYSAAMGSVGLGYLPSSPYFQWDQPAPLEPAELYVSNNEDSDPVTAPAAPYGMFFLGWYRNPGVPSSLLTTSQELIEESVTEDGEAFAKYAAMGYLRVNNTLAPAGTSYMVLFSPQAFTENDDYDFEELDPVGPLDSTEAADYVFPGFSVSVTNTLFNFTVSAYYVHDDSFSFPHPWLPSTRTRVYRVSSVTISRP